MSGFSEDVATAVTQPLWPVRDPRKRRDSIVAGVGGGVRALLNGGCRNGTAAVSSADSMAPAPARTSSETLLSTLHALNHKFDAAFPAGDAAQLHALSAQPPDVTYLSDVLTSSALFTASLLAHAPVADPKLVSLYREYVNHADSASRVRACGIRLALV